MKIGDFAKACGTRISVLRHYDKLGLLRPVYIDRFTEYRYYDRSQIAVFERISELKTVGFSLTEICEILYSDKNTEEIFNSRKKSLEKQLHDLERLINNGGTKMESKFKPLIEDIDIAFENDEQMIGKWQIVSENCKEILGDKKKMIYFLPNGERYWCYGWTKGKLIYDDGESRFADDCHLEQHGDDLYMIIDHKSQDYIETGEITPIALRKIDNIHYAKEQIARRDDINKPFVPDSRVIGKWITYCFLDTAEIHASEFIPKIVPSDGSPEYNVNYFKEITFSEGGYVTAILGDEIITGDDLHTWTRGFWLRKYNSSACAYEIKTFDGIEYLIIEWKSGDYRFGGCDTNYYVMVRA